MNYKWKGFNWCTYTHTKWDSVHYDNAYFGDWGVMVYSDCVDLSLVDRPLKFDYNKIYPTENGAVTKEICCGEIISRDVFSYGTYTWKVKLPLIPYTWPALWLCGSESWPPEIDVLEAYPDKDGNIIRNCLETYCETNVHYGTNKQPQHVKAKGVPTWLYKWKHQTTDEYKLVWKKNSIKFYFNGILFRTILKKKVLDYINKSPYMHVIMNQMVRNGFEMDTTSRITPMRVYDFQYKALE